MGVSGAFLRGGSLYDDGGWEAGKNERVDGVGLIEEDELEERAGAGRNLIVRAVSSEERERGQLCHEPGVVVMSLLDGQCHRRGSVCVCELTR